ncbi:hypothetical protein BJX99DRAFT_241153 [Aspergillus californicus]
MSEENRNCEGVDRRYLHLTLIASLCVYLSIAFWVFCKYSSGRDLEVNTAPFGSMIPRDTKGLLDVLERVAPSRPLVSWLVSIDGEEVPLLCENKKLICAICLDYVPRNHPIHTLECRHIFHGHCLEAWFLSAHYNCPLCRIPFINTEMYSECDV